MFGGRPNTPSGNTYALRIPTLAVQTVFLPSAWKGPEGASPKTKCNLEGEVRPKVPLSQREQRIVRRFLLLDQMAERLHDPVGH